MNILRWLLLLPISMLCSIIFPYLYKQIAELFVSENTFADSFLLSGFNFFQQGIFFIVPAYFVAPKFKIQTLKIFLILWILVVVFGDYYLYSTNRENIGIWNSLLRIFGASLAYLNITLEHKDETIHSTNEEKPQEIKKSQVINETIMPEIHQKMSRTDKNLLIAMMLNKKKKEQENRK